MTEQQAHEMAQNLAGLGFTTTAQLDPDRVWRVHLTDPRAPQVADSLETLGEVGAYRRGFKHGYTLARRAIRMWLEGEHDGIH